MPWWQRVGVTAVRGTLRSGLAHERVCGILGGIEKQKRPGLETIGRSCVTVYVFVAFMVHAHARCVKWPYCHILHQEHAHGSAKKLFAVGVLC